MTDADIIQRKQNDEAHERYLAHLLALRQSGQITSKQRIKAVEDTYDAFNHRNTPQQTWTVLCNLAKKHGLDLTEQVTA